VSARTGLRTGLYVIGAACLVGALWAPQLLVPGLVLVIGLAIERSRYKTPAKQRVEPHWQDTGERFVDPETGSVTAVYFDPRTSERHYVAVASDRPLP